MNSNRLKMLEQFVKEEPNDPFNSYALALEYLHSDQQKAKQLFDFLLDRHPDYLPTYYVAGNLFLESGDPEKGILILKSGIEQCKKAGDFKAAQEIHGLLSSIE